MTGPERTAANRPRVVRFLARHRLVVQVVLDTAAWWGALIFASCLRFDFDIGSADWPATAAVAFLASLLQLAMGLGFGLYTGRWRFGSFDEVAALAQTSAIATALLFALNAGLFEPHLVPRSVTLGAGVTALVVMGATRYLWRAGLERQRRPVGEALERLLVFGAGEGGFQVVTAMLGDPRSPYVPVALLDDDPGKRNLRFKGIPVAGGRARLANAATRHGATGLLIAIPSADAELVSQLTDKATAAGLTVKVLPPVGELFGAEVGVRDIRDVTVADLLGRRKIETDLDAIADYLTGKRVLVTGAGGSIGSELCRQLYRFAPVQLVLLDRDESALHALQLSIEGRALLDSPHLVLADIRDGARLHQAFDEHRPEVVFHTAALKHLALLERHPTEALHTNVGGTLTVLEAAQRSGVERFVNISTDKAADPTSVLGWSKRISERLTAHFAHVATGTYISVRFGNVLASRGSVLTTFHAQVAAGGPITVTDPDVTRYFMTVEEATQLVIQAGAIGRDGEVLAFDLGDPVRIDDIARVLADRAPRPIDIVYTGLRPGEKLHEVLLGRDEVLLEPAHPLISHVRVPPIAPEQVRAIDPGREDADLAGRLSELSYGPALRTGGARPAR